MFKSLPGHNLALRHLQWTTSTWRCAPDIGRTVDSISWSKQLAVHWRLSQWWLSVLVLNMLILVPVATGSFRVHLRSWCYHMLPLLHVGYMLATAGSTIDPEQAGLAAQAPGSRPWCPWRMSSIIVVGRCLRAKPCERSLQASGWISSAWLVSVGVRARSWLRFESRSNLATTGVVRQQT